MGKTITPAGVDRFASSVPEPWPVLMERFWPGPLTLLFPAREGLPAGVVSERGEVALRVPGSGLCREVIAAGERLLLAGPPDFADPVENLAAIEGRRKAKLLVLRTDDGVTEATYPLDSPPIYDGIASVSGRLYVCTMDGRIACLAAP